MYVELSKNIDVFIDTFASLENVVEYFDNVPVELDFTKANAISFELPGIHLVQYVTITKVISDMYIVTSCLVER